MLVVGSFEWDEAKAASNARRHGVTFELALAVFADADRLIVDATREADGEPRAKVIGRIEDRLYAVVLTMRGETCRLISARRTNPKEARLYYGDR